MLAPRGGESTPSGPSATHPSEYRFEVIFQPPVISRLSWVPSIVGSRRKHTLFSGQPGPNWQPVSVNYTGQGQIQVQRSRRCQVSLDVGGAPVIDKD